jgi:hypothetical protein
MQAIEWPPLAEGRQQRTETHFPVAMFNFFPFPRDSVLPNQTEALLYRSSMEHLYGDPIYMTSCKYGNSTGFKWKSFMDSSVLLPPLPVGIVLPAVLEEGIFMHDYVARC